MTPRQKFTTSQLADAATVGPQTLRYYERRGLLPEPPRTTGGHRIYGAEHLQRLLFIQRAQGLGFRLLEIQEMLVLGSPSAEGVEKSAEMLIRAIDEKLAALKSMRRSLERILSDGADPDMGMDSGLPEALYTETV